jgi:class 3 adenylate cyclase
MDSFHLAEEREAGEGRCSECNVDAERDLSREYSGEDTSGSGNDSFGPVGRNVCEYDYVRVRSKIAKKEVQLYAQVKTEVLFVRYEMGDLEVPVVKRPLRIERGGKEFEVIVTPETTASEVLLSLGATNSLLLFQTFHEERVLKGLDSPFLEIVKWKAENGAIGMSERKGRSRVIASKTLLVRWGYTLSVCETQPETKQDSVGRYFPAPQKSLYMEKPWVGIELPIKYVCFEDLLTMVSQIASLLANLFLWAFCKRSVVRRTQGSQSRRGEKERETCGPAFMDLSNMGLVEIPEMIYRCKWIRHLDVSKNHLRKLPIALNKLNLHSLNASCNSITEIPELRIPRLNLENNQIREFTSKYSYQEVNLLRNPLEKFSSPVKKLYLREIIHSDAIYPSLKALKNISLADVELRELTGEFPALQVLRLRNNNLGKIQIGAPCMQVLECVHNLLNEVPVMTGKRYYLEYPSIRYVSLAYNNINVIPKVLWQLPIEYLDMSHNQLVNVEPSAKQNTLRHLNLSSNKIKQINKIHLASSLVCLILSFNEIENIEGLSLLPNLKRAVLSNNLIIHPPALIPTSFRIPGERLLFLDGNPHIVIRERYRKLLRSANFTLVENSPCDRFLSLGANIRDGRCVHCGCISPSLIKEGPKEIFYLKTDIRCASPDICLDVFIYLSVESERTERVCKDAIRAIKLLVQRESEAFTTERWPKIREKVFDILHNIRGSLFPDQISLFSVVIVGKCFVFSMSMGKIHTICFMHGRHVLVNEKHGMSLVYMKRTSSLEYLLVAPAANLHNISVHEMYSTLKRSRSLMDARNFFISHPIGDLRILLLPLWSTPMPRKEIVFNPRPSFSANEPVIVFTDIVNSTWFWALNPLEMRDASKIHNRVIRNLLWELKGYEVKTEGDAFMLAFCDDAKAVEFGAKVHLRLVNQIWSETILSHNPLFFNKKKPVFRGLQIRVGMSKGNCILENDPVTQRIDFYGKTVIEAARLCSIASGGETFISHSIARGLEEGFPKKNRYILINRGKTFLAGLGKHSYHVYELLHRKVAYRAYFGDACKLRGRRI